MKYIKNHFLIEKIKAIKLAKKYKTPAYCYSFKLIKDNIISFKKNFKSITPLICFSVKSTSNTYLLKEMKKFGLGAPLGSAAAKLSKTLSLHDFYRNFRDPT